MAIKDMQTLYDEGHLAGPLGGSELVLIEQDGLSKVARLDDLAVYFQQYFEANSDCCSDEAPDMCVGATPAAVFNEIAVNGLWSVTINEQSLNMISGRFDDIIINLEDYDISVISESGETTFFNNSVADQRLVFQMLDAGPMVISLNNDNPTVVLDGSGGSSFCLLSGVI